MPENESKLTLSEQLHELYGTAANDNVIRHHTGLKLPEMREMAEPAILTATNGVGPKLRIAAVVEGHENVGRDCVAMCVNDLICSGAKPISFSAYTASEKYSDDRLMQIAAGIAAGCREAGCCYIGGSRMEKATVYSDGKYDLAGFAIGILDAGKMIDGSGIVPGDILLGLASNGLHNNGFGIIHDVFQPDARSLRRHIPEISCSLADALLRPSAIYARSVLYVTDTLGLPVKGMAHITDGGVFGSLPRMLPKGIGAVITPSSHPIPAIFDLISQRGHLDLEEMYRHFNMGTGFVMAVSKEQVGSVYSALIMAGEHPYMAGYCVEGDRDVRLSWEQL